MSMESSSENSFTWTDTSNDSDNSSSITAGEKASDSINSPETESKYSKKKKSKTSSKSCNGTKADHDPKLEIKMAQEQDQDHFEEKKKILKLEPESDLDIPKKKKKHMNAEVECDQNYQQDSACYDENYLNLRVKEEILAISTKRKRKHSSVGESTPADEFKYKDSSTNAIGDTASQDFYSATTDSDKRKKKKKKSKRRTYNESQDDVEMNSDNNNIEMDEEKQHMSPNKSRMSVVRNTSIVENDTFQDESGYDEISAIQYDGNDNLHSISINNEDMSDKQNKNKDNLYKSTIVSQFKIANSNMNHEVQLSQGAEKRTPRISDRLRFEDSDDPDVEHSHTQVPVIEERSSKLRKFMKTNSNIKLVTHKLQNSSILTRDDEIWIVKCPKDIDIQTFCSTDLNLHGKCKLKIGGRSYDGSLEDAPGDTTTALSMICSRYKIENLPLCGIINFRKRIPKAHIQDDNIMVNNQTNFIPLPETKCRHPLFGSNYKKALKIPASIAERLNTNMNVEGSITTEMKKKKRQKKEIITDHQEADSRGKYGTLEQHSSSERQVKKQKKRKHTDDEGPSPKRLKKIKHDPESAEAWESEKAIEQNLFDF